jgi:transposase
MLGEAVKVTNPEPIPKLLHNETDPALKLRLTFLNFLAHSGISFEKCVEYCGIGRSTAYSWIEKWNRGGYEALKTGDKKGGRPPRLPDDHLGTLRQLLKGKEYWTTNEIRKLIRDRFGVDYSPDQVSRILKKKLRMRFGKPYPHDYRKPKNAKMTLGKRLKATFKKLWKSGIEPKDVALGFLDEVGAQNKANTVRVWSFGRVRIAKNTTHFRVNTVGFYAIKGESLHSFIEKSNGETVKEFLEKVRVANKEFKAVIVVLDNAPSHTPATVVERCEQIGISLVYLPPYSPDLNPIEFLWKSAKRFFSLLFPRDAHDLKEKISTVWHKLCDSVSCATGWIRSFLIGKTYSMGFSG